MKKSKWLLSIAGVALTVVATGCASTDTVDQKQQQQEQQMQTQMQSEVGMPVIKNWTEKKLFKQILELRDRTDLVTYVYTEDMSGKFVYLGKGIGFGLPYSTQYTNPEQTTWNNGNMFTLPQSDPNGLFMPSSSEASWIVLINPKTGKREITYMEPRTAIFQSKLPANMCEQWSLPKNY